MSLVPVAARETRRLEGVRGIEARGMDALPDSRFLPRDLSTLLKRAVDVLWLCVILVLVWMYMMGVHANGLSTQKATHYAQVSANVAYGKGLATNVTVPLGLMDVPRIRDHPDLWYAPAYALLQGFFFWLLRPSWKVAALVSGLGWASSVALVWVILFRRHGRFLAWFGFLLLLANPVLLKASVSGLPLMWSASLLLLLHILLLRSHERAPDGDPSPVPWAMVVLTGVVVSALGQFSYDLSLAAILLGLMHWLCWPARHGLNRRLVLPGEFALSGDVSVAWLRQRLAPRMAGVFLGVVFLLALPWMLRRVFWAGDLFYSLRHYELLCHTSLYPGQSVFRTYDPLLPSPLEFLIRYPMVLATKWFHGFFAGGSQFLWQSNPLVIVLALAAVFRPVADHPHARTATHGFFAMLLMLSAIALHDWDFGSAIAIVPMMVVAAVGEAALWQEPIAREEWVNHWLLKTKRWRVGDEPLWLIFVPSSRRGLAMVALCVFSAVQLLSAFVRRDPQETLVHSANVPWLAHEAQRGRCVLTASPWSLAWPAMAIGVWMPGDPGSLKSLISVHGEELPWMYFPRQRAAPPSEDPVPDFWFELIRSSQPVHGYAVASSQAPGEYVRYCRP